MNGPTICRLPCGSARRTTKPSPRSRVRGTMIRSSASQVLGSPSTGSLEGCQLIGGLLDVCGDHTPSVAPRKRCAEMERTPPRHCERSEAIHGAACREMDCFVACAPLHKRLRLSQAMTTVSTWIENNKARA